MKIFKEKAGVISPGACWVCFSGCYFYSGDTLCGLLWLMWTEWKDDKNLWG